MTRATYSWSGGREAMLRFGPANGPVIIAAMPLFEEANRTRAFVVAMLRALAQRGIASVLPDLPGTGDSLVTTEQASLTDWRSAFSAVARGMAPASVYALSLRGGALLDTDAALAGRYHLAPASGAAVVREMLRVRLAVASDAGERFDPIDIAPPGPPVQLAGNYVNRQLLADLAAANPTTTGPTRTARLDADPGTADIKFGGVALWRRAEPGNDVALAALIADDMATWIAACEA